MHSCKIYWLDFMHSDRELIKISVLSKDVFINSIKNIWLVKIFFNICIILLYLFRLSQHLIYFFSFFASFNINIIYVLIYLTFSHCIKRLIVLILKAEFQTKEQEAFEQQFDFAFPYFLFVWIGTRTKKASPKLLHKIRG